MAYDKNSELSALASNRGSAQIKRDDHFYQRAYNE
jgi:hypothetical protein